MSLPYRQETPPPTAGPQRLTSPGHGDGVRAARAAMTGAAASSGGRAGLELALAALEKRRKAAARLLGDASARPPLDAAFLARATLVSFALDGVVLTAADVDAALARGPRAAHNMRARQSHRVRNHVALLRRADRIVRRGAPLEPDDVIGWYASIACGLSTAAISASTQNRLADVVARVNSPQLRLRSAVEDAAGLYVALLDDPFVPAFNGILARVLLHVHLCRCGLPPVLFDAPTPGGAPDARGLPFSSRLVVMLVEAYDRLVTAATSPFAKP